jgi:hypothetical protein
MSSLLLAYILLTIMFTAHGSAPSPEPKASVISVNVSSKASRVRQLAVGKEPTIPAFDEAITSLAFETINIGD